MNLFKSLSVGELTLPNRIIMAPLTRSRAVGGQHVPNDLMAEYYAQRSTAGLIITEATAVDPMAIGYPNVPGIWSEDQTEGWKKITRAVHDKGGRIFLQLWHVGRVSHPMYLDGKLPIAPSAIAVDGHVTLVRPKTPYPVPRALRLEEIPSIVGAFKLGAINAQRAGFDGVEIHGANGYLLDQFLQDSSNHRDDIYGGSIENRVRFMLEVTDAAISVWGAGRVGMHLAPRGDAYNMGDSNPSALFTHLAKELGQRKLAFICAREHISETSIGDQIKQAFGGIYIANENIDPSSAEQIISQGKADAVAFGQLYIANPDLVDRIKSGASMNKPNPNTYYTDGYEGYTDYPFLNH